METRHCGYGKLEAVLRPRALWTIVVTVKLGSAPASAKFRPRAGTRLERQEITIALPFKLLWIMKRKTELSSSGEYDKGN